MKEGSEIKSSEEQFSNFVESAAHDLHAPLRKLSVLVERVFEKNSALLEGDTKEYVNRIENCIQEMQSLINGLTELARADVNKVFNELCDLNIIVKQTIDALRKDNDDKRIDVELETLPAVKGNKIQFQQLFKNLLENAVKFRRENAPIKIQIKVNSVIDEEKEPVHFAKRKKFYKIEICDNGIGFNQDYAEKIFEPFVRLHPRSKYEGNGLGLSICKKIAENHHGFVYAR
ncbi:MAG TPA: ATP-binding protein, partial [Chitinophagaceae bacterium]